MPKISVIPPSERAIEDGAIIGHLAAGTTVTQPMIMMMMADYLRGEPPALYMDGNGRTLFTKIITEFDEDCDFSIEVEKP